MAAKHGEVTRRLSDGWTLGWDTTDVDPALRKATDEIVDSSVAKLQRLLGLSAELPAAAAPKPRRRAARRSAA